MSAAPDPAGPSGHSSGNRVSSMHLNWSQVRIFFRMVKIEHSIFALPFALVGVFLAADGRPGWVTLMFLILAMVAVRSFAMAVNRLVDRDIDAKNPRTSNRPLVTGEMRPSQAWILTLSTGLIFVLSCAALNQTCLLLSPLALLWSGLYSYSKRFTWLCHFWLGSVLGLAPLGGWLAHEPRVSMPAVLFFFGVLFWVAGFDILYACQDTDFDRSQGLRSIPAVFGVPSALQLSFFSHGNAALFFLLAGWSASLGAVYFLVWLGVSGVLLFEHRLVTADDLSRIDLAFFTLNGLIAVLLCVGVLGDLFWQ